MSGVLPSNTPTRKGTATNVAAVGLVERDEAKDLCELPDVVRVALAEFATAARGCDMAPTLDEPAPCLRAGSLGNGGVARPRPASSVSPCGGLEVDLVHPALQEQLLRADGCRRAATPMLSGDRGKAHTPKMVRAERGQFRAARG